MRLGATLCKLPKPLPLPYAACCHTMQGMSTPRFRCASATTPAGPTKTGAVKLTEYLVASAAVPEGTRDAWLWDETIPGLGVRIFATGASSYVVQYRNADGRTRRVTLGKTAILKLAQARERARAMLADVAGGVDPATDRQEKRRAPTVADLVARYRTDHLPRKKPSSRRGDERILARAAADVAAAPIAKALAGGDRAAKRGHR